jgi:hypothetical protein
MSTITLHGDRSPDGRSVGKPRTGLMSSRDPVTVARAAKQLIWSGHWQTQIASDDRTKVMMSLKARMPWAVGHVHVDALTAITKQVAPGTCHWDAALLVRGPGEPELPRTEANLVLLGKGCQRCRLRWATAEAAQGEREHLDQLTAGGGTTVAAVCELERARSLVAQAGRRRAGRY